MEAHKIRNGIFGYFQSLGYYEYRNGFMKGDCCYCGSEDKAGVHIERGFYNCFKCGPHGKLLKVIQDQEGMRTYGEVLRFLETYDGVTYKPPKADQFEERPVILPEGFKLLKYGDTRIGRMARRYMKNRGFDIKELSRRGIGYVGRPKVKYFGYIIFPFYRNRRIIYFQSRLFFGTGPKFKNPTQEDFGVGKSQFIYNEGALDRFKEIYLCESVMNALTMGDAGIAINGKSISRIQMSMILKSKCEIINILLDPDAWDEAIKLSSSLVDFKWVRVIQLPDDQDVNDLGKEAVMDLITDQSQLYNEINNILKLKWNT